MAGHIDSATPELQDRWCERRSGRGTREQAARPRARPRRRPRRGAGGAGGRPHPGGDPGSGPRRPRPGRHRPDHGPAAAAAGAGRMAAVEPRAAPARHRDLRDHVRADHDRRDRRLPPPAHAPELQDLCPDARPVRDPRHDGDRGTGDLVGGRPPQASRLLRSLRRPAQSARGQRRRLARGAPRPRARPRRMAVRPHPARRPRPLRRRPARRSRDQLHRPHLPAVVAGRPGDPVRARHADRRQRGRGAGGAAVGRRGARLPAAPRHLQHQLAVPLLRAAALRHERSVAQPAVAGAAVIRRGLAQQPSRLPDLRLPRHGQARGRPLGPADLGARARGARLGRPSGSIPIAGWPRRCER